MASGCLSSVVSTATTRTATRSTCTRCRHEGLPPHTHTTVYLATVAHPAAHFAAHPAAHPAPCLHCNPAHNPHLQLAVLVTAAQPAALLVALTLQPTPQLLPRSPDRSSYPAAQTADPPAALGPQPSPPPPAGAGADRCWTHLAYISLVFQVEQDGAGQSTGSPSSPRGGGARRAACWQRVDLWRGAIHIFPAGATMWAVGRAVGRRP